jgi:hypothetical protein
MRFFTSPLFLLIIFVVALGLVDSVFGNKTERAYVIGLPPVEQNELIKASQNENNLDIKGEAITPLSQSETIAGTQRKGSQRFFR